MSGYVMKLGVGMYVVTRGRSRGRIVDRRTTAYGTVEWLVKLENGELLWFGTGHLTERV